MITSFAQYVLLVPYRINVLNVYAVCLLSSSPFRIFVPSSLYSFQMSTISPGSPTEATHLLTWTHPISILKNIMTMRCIFWGQEEQTGDYEREPDEGSLLQ